MLEGYFPDQSQHSTFVRTEEARSSLILEAGEGAEAEEHTDLPPTHAQALLAVSHRQVEYLHTSLTIGPHKIQALHVVRPGPLDLVAVTSASREEPDLPPLPWFCPDVSAEPAHQRWRLALDGAPAASETEVTNAAPNSLLDLLEDRITTWPWTEQPGEPDGSAVAAPANSVPPMPVPETKADEESDDLGIEDTVIRELARALQPRSR